MGSWLGRDGGNELGSPDGAKVGPPVGPWLGRDDGSELGSPEGARVGPPVGS